MTDRLRTVVKRAHREGFTVQSDFARRYAEYVAAAASMRLITTRLEHDCFGRTWIITVQGLQWLRASEGNVNGH